MRSFINTNIHLFLLVGLFVASELLVNPLGEFPLNDDWAYTKSLLFLTNEGKLDIGEWPAMTLVSHLVWGAMFVKLAGFSFFILRLSTLISSIIGLCIFFKLLLKVTHNNTISLLGALTLLVCPLYFNLSNTFMTDVNFNTLIVLACYVAFRFYETRGTLYIVLITAVSVALVMMRQFGIVVPVCFMAGCLFLKGNSKYYIFAALGTVLIVYAILHAYEFYLRGILAPTASYKFSGGVAIFEKDFYESFLRKVTERWKAVLITVSLYLLPFTAICLRQLAQYPARWKVLVAVILSAGFSIVFLKDYPPQLGNVFRDMSVGAETFYQSLNDIYGGNTHTWSPGFTFALELAKHLSVTMLLLSTLVLLISRQALWERSNRPSPFQVFLFTLLIFYLALLCVTDSYFDRYHIPAITLALIIFAGALSKISWSWKLAILPLLCYAYVSIAGTHDYFTVNRIRWMAYDKLRQEGVPPGKINAGFEVNCWDEGNYGWWVNFLTTDNFDYLIQYRNEPGFVPDEQYMFQRIFPPKRDKIGIYRRAGLPARAEADGL